MSNSKYLSTKIFIFHFHPLRKNVTFLFRSIVGGFWGGVYAVGVHSEAGANESSVLVCLGAAGGGLS